MLTSIIYIYNLFKEDFHIMSKQKKLGKAWKPIAVLSFITLVVMAIISFTTLNLSHLLLLNLLMGPLWLTRMFLADRLNCKDTLFNYAVSILYIYLMIRVCIILSMIN